MENEKNLTPRQLILLDLRRSDRPKLLNHIAKDTGLQPQLVDYHIRIMMKMGTVITISENGKKYYMLQPVFYDETLIEGVASALLPVLEAFSKEIIFEQIKTTPKKALFESFKNLLEIFILEIQNDFEKNI